MFVGSKSKMLGCWALLMLPFPGTPLVTTPVRGETVASVDTPDGTAHDFYAWYVHILAHDKEATDDPSNYERFVSKALRARIARQMASADGMDIDYFIKTQDYLDDWLTHIAASPPSVQGNGTELIITLGAGGKRQRLAVKLVREDAHWKIASVGRV